MTTITKLDINGHCEYGQEQAMIDAANAQDFWMLGNLLYNRIIRSKERSDQYRQELKDSLRAEILAEVCAGGEA